MADIDFAKFEIKDDLNDKIWINDKLKPNIRNILLKNSAVFMKHLELGRDKIEDIVLTGSMANYNWTKTSDLDLHLIIDYSKLPKGSNCGKACFDLKRIMWNENRNIKAKGYDIELYVQDIKEPHAATGVFSILNNKWLIKPTKKTIVIDKHTAKKKARDIMDLIDHLSTSSSQEEFDRLKLKIKDMRSSGLDTGGEYSAENIAFKILRNNGYLQKLSDIKGSALDKELSLEINK